jgi:tetratricopeptide (TPR) repeat protein
MAVEADRELLRAVIEEMGWSYTRLIAEMRRVAAPSKLPKTSSLVSMLSRWLNGRGWPDDYYQDVLSKALRKPRAELFGEGTENALLKVTVRARPWELLEALEHRSIGPRALDQLERTVTGYVRAYPNTPPRALADPVSSDLRHLIAALKQPQPLKQRHRLVVAVARLAAVAGSVSFDLRDHRRALDYFEAARTAGDEAEDDDLLAWVLAMHSIVPAYLDSPQLSLDLLEGALHFARCDVAPSRLAWVASLKARAHAAVGDRAGCDEALGVAYDAMAATEGLERRPETDFFDLPRLDGLKGTCLLLLRQPEKAQPVLEDVLVRRDPSNLKGRSLIKLDLAAAHAQGGDPERACQLIREALSIPVEARVEPIARRARAIRVKELARWSTAPVVQALDEWLRVL